MAKQPTPEQVSEQKRAHIVARHKNAILQSINRNIAKGYLTEELGTGLYAHANEIIDSMLKEIASVNSN